MLGQSPIRFGIELWTSARRHSPSSSSAHCRKSSSSIVKGLPSANFNFRLLICLPQAPRSSPRDGRTRGLPGCSLPLLPACMEMRPRNGRAPSADICWMCCKLGLNLTQSLSAPLFCKQKCRSPLLMISLWITPSPSFGRSAGSASTCTSLSYVPGAVHEYLRPAGSRNNSVPSAPVLPNFRPMTWIGTSTNGCRQQGETTLMLTATVGMMLGVGMQFMGTAILTCCPSCRR
mmetsp:Transcript_87565/g.250876  ORF Transcript_87565/g.250876 Transcript_87565/m.250876 type:complete len:232 (+) Transcript_87565:413-1108(+)